MKKKFCLALYSAVHYRKSIFKLIDENFDCEFNFYLSKGMCEQFDTAILKGIVNKYYTKYKYGISFRPHLMEKTKRKFDGYICGAAPYDISTWLFAVKVRLLYPNRKIYLWTHGWYGKETLIIRMIKKIFFHLFHGIILYGDYAKQLMIQQGFNPQKLYVIHNSLDYEKQIDLRSKLQTSFIYRNHFDNNFPTLIFIGRLTRVKKLDQIIYAIKLLKEKNFRLNLTFVGDGTERIILERLVWEHGLQDSVWFYGACYDEEVNAELIYNADLCVSPGNVGLTAMHTMVFGTPVITHDNFAYQMPEFEAIHVDKTGAFFRYNDIDSLADTIENWFRLHGKERELIRENCYHEIDNYWTPQYQITVLKEHLN